MVIFAAVVVLTRLPVANQHSNSMAAAFAPSARNYRSLVRLTEGCGLIDWVVWLHCRVCGLVSVV